MLPPPIFHINCSAAAEILLEKNAYKVDIGVDEKTEATQVATLITVIGVEARRFYHTHTSKQTRGMNLSL